MSAVARPPERPPTVESLTKEVEHLRARLWDAEERLRVLKLKLEGKRTIGLRPRRILELGGIALALILVFPPWVQTQILPKVGSTSNPIGFGFLLAPPEPSRPPLQSIHVDGQRLFVEALIVAVIAGVAFVRWGSFKPAEESKPTGC